MDRVIPAALWNPHRGGLRLVLEPLLDWQTFVVRNDWGAAHTIVAGRESYHQLIWFIARERLLETDSGPLDAKVP